MVELVEPNPGIGTNVLTVLPLVWRNFNEILIQVLVLVSSVNWSDCHEIRLNW